jgi:uncharacterized membrane protein YcfT
MMTTVPTSDTGHQTRLDWVDVGKGICILLVVTMHSTLGVGEALGREGFMHTFVAFTKPFRMPDFFLFSGFLAAGTLHWPWRKFLDRKVLHFAYFYLLWLAILVALKSGALGFGSAQAGIRFFLASLLEPFSTLWFIHVLPLFFLVARWSKVLPAWLVLVVAASLHSVAAMRPDGLPFAMASKLTGWFAIDSFSLFLIYFLIGVRGHALIRALAERIARRPLQALMALGLWLFAYAIAWRCGITDLPGLTLLFGLAGALAILALAVLLAMSAMASPLAYCGRQSLAIYLAFVIPMVGMRELLVRTGLTGMDAGIFSLIVTTGAAIGPLIAVVVARRIGLSFLFERPSWAHLRA